MKPFNTHDPVKINEMNVGQIALHGDVVIERIKSLPDNFDKMEQSKDDCLAYGEMTGHVHKLFRLDENGVGGIMPSFDLRTDKDGIKFLKINESVALRHQEHREITLPPGEYKIKIQREFDPFTKKIRSVRD